MVLAGGGLREGVAASMRMRSGGRAKFHFTFMFCKQADPGRHHCGTRRSRAVAKFYRTGERQTRFLEVALSTRRMAASFQSYLTQPLSSGGQLTGRQLPPPLRVAAAIPAAPLM